MNANRHFDEDDLVMYALRLLPEPDQSALEQTLPENAALRERLATLQGLLGAYAEASVEPRVTPAGSLDQLMHRIALEPRRTQGNTVAAKQPLLFTPKRSSPLLWAGWAVAALLAITVGLLTHQWIAVRHMSAVQTGEVAALTGDLASLRRERDGLQANLSQQQEQAAALQSQAASLKNETSTLKTETTVARSGAAALQSKLAGQTSKLSEQTAKAEEAERAQSRLQDAMAAQAEQLALLSASTRDAQVLAALTDPTALRVVLTKPKSKPAPTGRAAYVLSKGTLVFLASNLTPLKTSKVYELWLMPADGSNPIPAGTFVPDAKGNATVAYPHFSHSVPAKGFAVTVENAGGSQVPTLPLVLAGV